MFYKLVKLMMRSALGMFYQQTLFRNMHHIPLKGPAILITNHPSSLMDAALLGVLLKRPIHFFARADIFKNPIVTRILNALHMHPIHHHQAGRLSLGANDATFSKVIQLLQKGELVLFFPEGISHTDYYLMPFKKGIFRIAFKTLLQNPSLQLPVIPLGLNYSQPKRLFGRFWVQAGSPILTNEFLPAYEQFPNQAIRQLADQAFISIKNLVIETSQKQSGNLYDTMEIWRNSRTSQELPADKRIEKEMAISQAQTNWLSLINDPLKEYQKDLKSAGVSDASIAAATQQKFSAMPLLMGFPSALIGWLLNALPLLISRTIADNKVKRVDFYSWILLTSAVLLYIIWFFFLLVIAFLYFPGWKVAVFLFIVIATGQYSWNYFSYYYQWKIQQQGRNLPPEKLAHLIVMRNKVLKILEETVGKLTTSPS